MSRATAPLTSTTFNGQKFVSVASNAELFEKYGMAFENLYFFPPISGAFVRCKQHKTLSSHFILSTFFFVTTDEFCEEYPHALIPTPGYWIECSRQKIAQINQHTIWDDSESDHDEPRPSCSGDGQHDRNYSDLYEDDEDSDFVPRRKTTIEEQWEQQQSFELTSVEQETYEKYFYGSEHWNYFTNDEGTVRLSPDTTATVVNFGVIDFLLNLFLVFQSLPRFTPIKIWVQLYYQ